MDPLDALPRGGQIVGQEFTEESVGRAAPLISGRLEEHDRFPLHDGRKRPEDPQCVLGRTPGKREPKSRSLHESEGCPGLVAENRPDRAAKARAIGIDEHVDRVASVRAAAHDAIVRMVEAVGRKHLLPIEMLVLVFLEVMFARPHLAAELLDAAELLRILTMRRVEMMDIEPHGALAAIGQHPKIARKRVERVMPAPGSSPARTEPAALVLPPDGL